MPTPHPPLPPPPQPTRTIFDPFQSSSTGHQRDKSRLAGTTSWQQSRTYKLAHQLKDSSGRGGWEKGHLADLVGAGSEMFGRDGRKENGDWERGAVGLRERGWQDIRAVWEGGVGGKRGREGGERVREGRGGGGKRVKREGGSNTGGGIGIGEGGRGGGGGVGGRGGGTIRNEEREGPAVHPNAAGAATGTTQDPTEISSRSQISSQQQQQQPPPSSPPQKPQIFHSLCLYLNGSTAPLVSDLRLKQLWVQHGGSISIGLGRRTVTHVVLGEDRGGREGGGVGGGLASSKIQKEVKRVGGKGVKYVSARWVLDCVERGRRVSEVGYGVVEGRVGGAGQGSVRGMFGVGGR